MADVASEGSPVVSKEATTKSRPTRVVSAVQARLEEL
jgi:hypothetical protein